MMGSGWAIPSRVERLLLDPGTNRTIRYENEPTARTIRYEDVAKHGHCWSSGQFWAENQVWRGWYEALRALRGWYGALQDTFKL